MKVLVNGGLNLSELDGWWAEAYAPDVGWALGDGQDHGDDPAWDAAEAEALYDRARARRDPGILHSRRRRASRPPGSRRMRESMARLTPRFSARARGARVHREHYRPAADAYRARAADGCALGRRIVTWRQVLEQQWPALRFDSVKVEAEGTHQAFEVRLSVHDLDPDAVRVELYANALNGDRPFRLTMTRIGRSDGASGSWAYRARIPATRPATDYTVRVVPHHDGVAVPLETPNVLWQR